MDATAAARRPRRRWELPAFLALAIGIAWGVGWLFAGVSLISPVFDGGPLIAALIVAGLAGGRADLGDLGRRLVRWRFAVRWYVAVVVLPIAVVGSAVAMNTILGGTPPDGGKALPPLMLGLLFVLFVVDPIGGPLGEEVGWRGFALPRLLASRSPFTASLGLGIVWALWHLPLVLADPATRPPVPFMASVVPLSFLFTWLFLHTGGSTLIAVLFHAVYDLVLAAFAVTLAQADAGRLFWLLTLVEVVAVSALVVWSPSTWFSRAVPAGTRDSTILPGVPAVAE